MNPTAQAALWMIGAIVSFSAMAVAGRELSGTFDTFEIMMYRSLIGLGVVLAIARVAGTLHEVSADRLGLHLMRNLAHFTGQNLWFFAVALIPLAQLFALEFTTPLWVILLSPLMLGERLTLMRLAAAALGFAGILIVARPDPGALNVGVLAAAASAVFFALTYIATKRLTRSQSITAIMVYMTGLQLVFGLAATLHDGTLTLPARADLPLLGVVAAGGLVAHFSITRALTLAPASVVAPIDFARLPVIALVGMLLYAEPLDPLVFLGGLAIFAANYLNIWSGTRSAPR